MSLEELRNPKTDCSLCRVTSDRHQVSFPVPVEPGIAGAFHVRVPRATQAGQPEATPQAGVPEKRYNRRDHQCCPGQCAQHTFGPHLSNYSALGSRSIVISRSRASLPRTSNQGLGTTIICQTGQFAPFGHHRIQTGLLMAADFTQVRCSKLHHNSFSPAVYIEEPLF